MSLQRPAPGELDPIETASRDEIASLQLLRLRWSVGEWSLEGLMPGESREA